MRKLICLVLTFAVFFAGCAGREADPVEVQSPGDNERSSELLVAEAAQPVVLKPSLAEEAEANPSSIAVNFADDDPKKTNDSHKVFSGGQKIGPTEIDSSFWNSTVDADLGTLRAGKKANLTDDKGAKTTAVVEWRSWNTWRIDAERTDTDEQKLLRSYLDDGSGGNLVTVSNIPYKKYNLYVLFAPGGGAYGLHTDVTVNGTDYPDDDEPCFKITYPYQWNRHIWIESDGTNTGNYIVVPDLTDSTLVFGSKFLRQDDGTESRGGIAGFIIEEASADGEDPA